MEVENSSAMTASNSGSAETNVSYFRPLPSVPVPISPPPKKKGISLGCLVNDFLAASPNLATSLNLTDCQFILAEIEISFRLKKGIVMAENERGGKINWRSRLDYLAKARFKIQHYSAKVLLKFL
jgi:hypothetical protein